MAKEVKWAPLGEKGHQKVDRNKYLPNGVIALPQKLSEEFRDGRVLVVHCGGGAAGYGPEIPMRVRIAQPIYPLVSEEGFTSLKADTYGPAIEWRELTRLEKAKRFAPRVALPLLAALGGAVALAGLIFSDLRDAAAIAAGVLVLPASLVACIKAVPDD